ncbi:MAG: hypothetical protein R2873_34975 [Caldilineaceae bacterium]
MVTELGVFHLPQLSSPGTHTLLIRPRNRTRQPGPGRVRRRHCGVLTAVSFRSSDYHIDIAVKDSHGVAHTSTSSSPPVTADGCSCRRSGRRFS